MLSEHDRNEAIRLIQSGRPLPLRFRNSLFEDAAEIELIWPGKTAEVDRVVLPFQSIEHIDEPRSEHAQQFDLFTLDSVSGRQSGGWTNKLIWGDNKLILSSLTHGPLRQQIDDAGGLKLIYIDPPFDVGADFSFEVHVGGEDVTKSPSVVEEVAYRDTWGRGLDSYASMIFERLRLLYDLLASDGTIVVHCDFRTGHIIRCALDEVFGAENHRNEIVWWYRNSGMKATSKKFHSKHDLMYVYSKSSDYTFNGYREPLRDGDAGKRRQYKFDSVSKKPKPVYDEAGNPVYYQVEDILAGSVWDVPIIQGGKESVGYPTQKPEALLERVITAYSNEGDLVADFFVGSGTTIAVAEKLERKWIGADLGRFAIHTSRKRLISVQRELQAAEKTYRAFEILNLGSYERQYFAGIDPMLPPEERLSASELRREQYLELVLSAYGAKRSTQLKVFHGVKDTSAVFVGPLDAPVTQAEVNAAISSARNAGISRVDIIGFEFEMGIKPAMIDEAKDRGVSLTLRYIPNDVFDKRAIQRGQVKFYDVGYLEANPVQLKDGSIQIELANFAVFYAQADADAAAEGLRPGGSRVVVDNGQVVRVSKDKKGAVSREVLTKSWSDWIDYWAVDFDFESQKEVISQEVDGEVITNWTGRYIFENQWQDFRTRGNRELLLISAPHTYDSPGEYKVAVKVVDVFGNDTTKVIKVKVK